MLDEYLDLVNGQDEIIGKKLRSAVYAEGLLNFRVVNAFLVNQQGMLWIPRRSLHKRLFPGGLDIGMGGHVESGETYEQAFERELAEELNLNLREIIWKELGHLTPQDGVSVFMKVYEISIETTPEFNLDDFTESFWLKPIELMKLLEAGEFSKSDLPVLLRKFYL